MCQLPGPAYWATLLSFLSRLQPQPGGFGWAPQHTLFLPLQHQFSPQCLHQPPSSHTAKPPDGAISHFHGIRPQPPKPSEAVGCIYSGLCTSPISHPCLCLSSPVGCRLPKAKVVLMPGAEYPKFMLLHAQMHKQMRFRSNPQGQG